jgi:hypothetical protein
MLQLRPIVVNKSNVVLGGNQRLKACIEAGLKEVFIIRANELTDEQKQEFIIKDNVGFGEWDWDQLANEWDSELLNDWGLFVPEMTTEVDYSILDDEDLDNELSDMADGVKKPYKLSLRQSITKKHLSSLNFGEKKRLM